MDFTASVNGNEVDLSFNSPKIQAKMNVTTAKMFEVVKWVMENF